MINTSKGPKTPAEALNIFKKALVPAGELLGILRQLLADHPEEAKEAVTHVNKYPKSYNGKIQTLAREKATGLPVGAKAIHHGGDIQKVLGNLDLGSSVHITFVEKIDPRRLAVVMGMDRVIKLDGNARAMLINCVIPSGRWEGIPRTCQARIFIHGGADLEMCQEYLPGVVEKIELICTHKQFVVANDPCPDILAKNPDLFFDPNLFRTVCAEMNRLSEASAWIAKLGSDPSMEEVLECFPYVIVRAEFLELYVAEFNKALV